MVILFGDELNTHIAGTIKNKGNINEIIGLNWDGNGLHAIVDVFDLGSISMYKVLSKTGYNISNLITDSRGMPIFFTSWDGDANFPFAYGSGVSIPCMDVRNRMLFFIGLNGVAYYGIWSADVGITWKAMAV